MKILQVPQTFQPTYRSKYPPYSNGQNMEEIFFEMFSKNKNTINTEYIYIPIFWTSFYLTRNYGKNINDLLDFLDKLDKSKKYFTIVQYATGIFVRNLNSNIMVFNAGGGGLNIKSQTEKHVTMNNNPNRVIFVGKKGDYDLTLICKPLMKSENKNKDIYCSFVGRFDTHPCRYIMQSMLNNPKFQIMSSVGYTKYKDILDRSVFALCPRGYGYTSFRIYEAMLCNCIPIYIWEDKIVLPFSDEVDWDDLCILIHSKDIKNIPLILNKVNITEKLDNIKKFNDKYLSFEGNYEYILRKIK